MIKGFGVTQPEEQKLKLCLITLETQRITEHGLMAKCFQKLPKRGARLSPEQEAFRR